MIRCTRARWASQRSTGPFQARTPRGGLVKIASHKGQGRSHALALAFASAMLPLPADPHTHSREHTRSPTHHRALSVNVAAWCFRRARDQKASGVAAAAAGCGEAARAGRAPIALTSHLYRLIQPSAPPPTLYPLWIPSQVLLRSPLRVSELRLSRAPSPLCPSRPNLPTRNLPTPPTPILTRAFDRDTPCAPSQLAPSRPSRLRRPSGSGKRWQSRTLAAQRTRRAACAHAPGRWNGGAGGSFGMTWNSAGNAWQLLW